MIQNQAISLSQVFVQNPGHIVSDMDGEKVMLNVQKGKYYNLGEVGGKIWDLVATPISVEQVVTALMSSYDVEQEKCEEQVLSFLELLIKEELIQFIDDSNP